MHTLTEIRRMKHELKKEIVCGYYWFNLALKWVLGEKQAIRGYKLTNSTRIETLEEKVRRMRREMKNARVWCSHYFTNTLSWVLGERAHINGHELSKQLKEKVIFT